ncbi:ribose-5-phosphate isomerase RpiA [Devosia sp. BK]|uniref:ribose-5-phosphate isomerase RpiA n=1 Tax=unclassified Devosia TaxID=196773 RepID=UPI000714061E|nr:MULTISPECIES: ribose-5-phosphate isomerase RpiA [unclassified Devosia]KQT49798.1 ribose 5-phosphate isomerase [Devosia sp. Leaf420]MDV3251506.1 ribose-5-phosphate isomerase RpiA [Devosia sp. BK]
MSEDLKREAARRALEDVRPGMRLGLGTGSTARHFVDLLGERVAQGLDVICVPTSEVTAEQARGLGIPLSDLDRLGRIDLTVDGADELDANLNLIKGGGGALLREKIVAAASSTMIVIADSSKVVDTLGRFPLPIEVNRFGLGATRALVAETLKAHGAEGALKLRGEDKGEVFVTDGGHLILDAFFGRISQPEALSRDLLDIPGVVQHGLFLNMCSKAYVAAPDGVKTLLKGN